MRKRGKLIRSILIMPLTLVALFYSSWLFMLIAGVGIVEVAYRWEEYQKEE